MERLYEDVKQMIHKEIEAIVDKEEMTPGDLENLYKFIDIVKDIAKMEECEMEMTHGASGAMPRTSGGAMPYYGAIMYDDTQWGKSGARSGRSSYGSDGGDRYGRGNSYGRYDDMRMMPDGRWN